MIKKNTLLIILCALFNPVKMQAQTPAFYHLSTAEGLSDNNVRVAARDRNGIVWIATSEGLNSFDGNRINTYDTYKYPLLGSNNIEKIVIDNDNRIWLRTNSKYINMLDENRKMHRFTVGDSADNSNISAIFFSASRGMFAVKNRKHFLLDKNNPVKFIQTNMPFDSLLTGTFGFNYYTDKDWVIYYRNNNLIVADYAANKALLQVHLPGLNGAHYINNDELIAYTSDGDVFYRISISQKKVVKEYRNIKDQNNKLITGRLRNMDRIDENRFAFSSYFSGIYILDLQKEMADHWEHDPVDERSIGGNNTFNIEYDSSGYLFVTTLTSGLHFYNIKQQQATSKPYFIDDNNQIFDGYIQSVVSDDESNIWMGAQDRLIMWNRKSGKTVFVPCFLPDGTNISGKETIRAVKKDEDGRLWVGTSRYGILILNKSFKTVAQIDDSVKGKKTGLPFRSINSICNDDNGNSWIGTFRGVCLINNKTLQITTFTDDPLLNKLSKIPCEVIWKDESGRIWFGTTRGAWCYDQQKKSLTDYSKQNGFPDDLIYDINQDKLGNIYLASVKGLSIMSPDGKIKSYNKGNGLRNDRCEGVLRDNDGFMWIGNLNCIMRYDPVNKTFAVFEEGLGFSHAGFRMRYSYKSAAGEMFWGTDKGLTYFYPQQMTSTLIPLHPFVNELQTDNNRFHFTSAAHHSFPYNTSSFSFYFSSGELGGAKKIQYLYQLQGFDKDWKPAITSGQVVYGNLPPGNYTFYLKASRNGITWFDAPYPVRIHISPPWWKQTWFRLLYIALAIGFIYLFYRFVQKRKKAREIKQAIEYFANSGFEHSTVDDILWDICRNCISRLGLEDCVIYVPDNEKKVLIQKAAYGNKNPRQNEIINTVEIPFGKGIVGDVAVTGIASIVNDTSKDSRYLVDDARRMSELTVPVVHDEKVIAVIDSAHRKKNFFTKQHLNALQTIAALCSAKISRAMAMDAMKKSELELMELNVKMAESKFLNLRLQMNPHFLFNSLSSIQHLIVSQQTNKAYKYLTIFSNFLRSLLNFAEKNFITLDEELKILNLYIELESLRFDDSFSFDIQVNENLNNDIVYVPSLMVQPFVENAIWHGLLHKEGEKKLIIRFNNTADDSLICEIEDNGIGRLQAAEIGRKKISGMIHESKGINIIKERLQLLQQKTGKPASLVFEDMADAGTKVIITIPYYNPEEL